MVQLSKFESAVAEYENLSNSTLSDDNKLAVVLRCLTGQLRTQATVLIAETSTYQDLRSLIERWDTSQTRWSTSLASTYGISASASSGGGPAPMDIDRVSKGKDKGKDLQTLMPLPMGMNCTGFLRSVFSLASRIPMRL